jgi:hypothetical protein
MLLFRIAYYVTTVIHGLYMPNTVIKVNAFHYLKNLKLAYEFN